MAGREKVDKNCEDCGVLLVNVDPHRKLCFECSRKRARAYQREHQKEYREYYQNYKKKQKEKVGEPAMCVVNPNKKYCKGCVYWGGDYENNYCCNYIFIEGHRRPCPPGKGCTEKTLGKRKRTMEFGENRE